MSDGTADSYVPITGVTDVGGSIWTGSTSSDGGSSSSSDGGSSGGGE